MKTSPIEKNVYVQTHPESLYVVGIYAVTSLSTSLDQLP